MDFAPDYSLVIFDLETIFEIKARKDCRSMDKESLKKPFKKMGRVKNCLVIYVVLLVLFVGLLCVARMIPYNLIEDNVDTSLEIINKEKVWGGDTALYTESTKLDSQTDSVMYGMLSNKEDSPLLIRVFGGYPRYWHGYMVFLRPLSILFSYSQLRYLNWLVSGILSFCVLELLNKRFGLPGIIAMGGSLMTMCAFVIPECMQYISVFWITLASMWCILKFPQYVQKKQVEFFFCVGMIVNFFDFLTYPLVTLGVPLALLGMFFGEKCLNIKKQFVFILQDSLAWGIGYGLCWGSKWILSSIVLKENIVKNALNTMIFRTSGNEEYPLNRLQMMKDNIRQLFSVFWDNKLLIGGIAVILLILVLVSFKNRKAKYFIPLLCISIYPYIWYNVLANHSQIHYYFTYRTQMITVFAILAFVCENVCGKKRAGG